MHVPPVFRNLVPFGFVHHRALNSRESLDAATRAARSTTDHVHVLEGDVCWHVDAERRVYYFRHPKLLTDVLTLAGIDEARERGSLLTLEEVIAWAEPDHRYIVELKNGVGDMGAAMRGLAGLLQEGLRDRYWLDGFSLRLLRAAKQADRLVPTSLHTKAVLGGWVLRTAPEFLPLSLHRIARLTEVDAITLTYKTSLARWFRALGATIDGTCRGVTGAGKTLILGGLTTPQTFAAARDSSAKAGYAKFSLSDLAGGA